MWLIFGATVGAAALVSHHKQQALHVDLGPPVKLGDASIRLPATWIGTRSTPRGGTEILHAVEKPSDESARQLYVFSEQLSAPVSIVEYLQHRGILPSADSPPARGAPRIIGRIDFGPTEGLLLDASLLILRPNSQSIEKDIVACTILPWRQAITVRLKGSSPFDPQDEQIVRQVAASLTTERVQSSASQLTLSGGIRIGLPDGYKPLNESDPLVTERQALLETPDGHWASLTLVPCILFPNDQQQAIGTLLSTRGLQWWDLAGTVHPFGSGPGEFAFGPLGESNNTYVTQGYLKASPTGQALMAFFHGATTELPLFEHAWQQLISRTQFNPEFKPRDLLLAGAAEQRRAATSERHAPIVPGSPDYWLWRHVPSDWNYGWSRITYTDPAASRGFYESRWKGKEDLEHVTQITINWQSNFAAHTYQRSLDRRDLQPGSPPAEIFTQSLIINSSGYTSTIASAFAAKAAQWSKPLPEQFVPGTQLPLVLSQLSGPPLIWRTDVFPDCEGLPMRDPFTLIIHPSPETTTQPASNSALRGITIEVNGSGRISRWYFNPDGSIGYIDFAGGLRRERTDAARIHELFDQDPELHP